ncbi:MAG: hypothetical protein HRT61_13345, partial [Ekhidna sp.]|nr:hypothetical protein [Ekhidna sp.]
WGGANNAGPISSANISFTFQSGALAGPSVDEVNSTGTAEAGLGTNNLVGGEEEVRVFFSYTGSAVGGETTRWDTDGNIFDDVNNTAAASQFPTDNEDDLSAPQIPTMVSAEWLDDDGDGNIDRVSILFDIDWDVDEPGGGDDNDGLDGLVLTNNGSPITQDNEDYDNIYSNELATTPLVITFDADQQPGTSIADLLVTFDGTQNDKIDSRTSGDVVSNGATPLSNLDGAAPLFANFSATILDDDADGNVDRIRVDAQDNIDDSAIDPAEFTYDGNAATGIANSDNTDESFTLLFNGSSTSVDGDFVYTPGVSLLDTASNASNGGTILEAAITDGAGPAILSAVTADTNLDGQIDEIELTFSEGFTDEGIDVGDFDLSDGFGTPAGVAISSPNVTLTLTPSGSSDTDAIPDVEVVAGGAGMLEDLSDDNAPNPAQTFTNTRDGAAPFVTVDIIGISSDPTPDLSGTVDDPNATVLISIGANSALSATNDGVGGWTLDGSSFVTPLDLQEYSVSYTTFDIASPLNIRSATVASVVDIQGGVGFSGPDPVNICIGEEEALTTISLTETATTDFSASGDVILSLPAGFEFNTSSAPSVINTNGTGDIAIGTVEYIGTSALSIELVDDGTDDGLDAITIDGLTVGAVGSTARFNSLISIGGDEVSLTATTEIGDLSSQTAPDALISLEDASDLTNTAITSFTARFLPRVTISYASPTGPFTPGEVVSFSGGAEGLVISDDTFSQLVVNLTSGTVANSETIEGADSGNSATTAGAAVGNSNELVAFSLEANPAGTANWYFDGIVDLTPDLTAATNDNTALNATTPGLYTYAITDDNGSCESEELLFNVLIYNDVHPNNDEGTFQDKTYLLSDSRDTIYMSNPAGHTVSLSGTGLSTVGGDTDPLLAIFDPELAGDDGGVAKSHLITYTITNNTTGQSASQTITLTVEPETSIFSGSPDDEYCNTDGTTPLQIDDTGFQSPAGVINPVILGIDVRGIRENNNNTWSTIEIASLDGEDLENGVYSQDAMTPYEFVFDPNVVSVDDGEYASYRFLRIIRDNAGVKRVDAENYFIIYGDPKVELANVSSAYCEDDSPFTIARNLQYVSSVDQTNPLNPRGTFVTESEADISNGYELYWFNGMSFQLIADFTGADALGSGQILRNDFDPTDPNRDGSNDAFDTGRFRIVYTTEDLGPTNCAKSITVQLDVDPDTPTPTLNAATLTGGGSLDFVNTVSVGGVDSDEYLLEYCVDDELLSFVTDDANTVTWYDENFNTIATNVTSVTPAQVGLSVSSDKLNAEQTIQFYFTSTDATNCESDYRLVTVSVYEIPDVPDIDVSPFPDAAQSGSTYTLDYCVEDGGGSTTPDPLSLADLEPDQSYNVNVQFIDASANSTVVNDIEITELTADTDRQSIAVDPVFADDTIIYTITKTENINRDAATSNFAGCEGDAIIVRIIGHEEVSIPTENDFVAGTTEFNICEGDALGNISHTFINGTDEYTWYEARDGDNNGLTRIGDVLGVGDPMTAAILGTAAGTPFDADVPATYTYYVARNNDVIDSREFTGCESEAIEVTITVHAIQPAVSISSDNSANATVQDLADLDANGSDDIYEFAICSDQLFSDLTFVAEDLYAAGPERVEWYNESTGNLLFTGENPTFGDLFLTGLNPQTVTFEVIQVTDTLTDSFGNYFDGCESEVATFTLTIADPDELIVVDDANVEVSDNYCRDDDPNGSGEVDVNLRIGGVPASDATNIDYEINSYLASTYNADPRGAPEVDGALQNNALPVLDLDALHDAVTGAQAVGGESTIHEVIIFYEDPSTFCVGSVTKIITINPDPEITFRVSGTDIGSFAAGDDQFCYEDGDVALKAFLSDGSTIGGSFSFEYVGGPQNGVTGNLVTTNGEASFNTIDRHNGFHSVTGTNGKFLNQSEILVTLNYTDGSGCDNAISATIFVDPEPEIYDIQRVTALPSADLASANGSNTIRVSNFCNDGTSVLAEIQLVDPDGGENDLETDYSNYSFEWSVGGSVVADIGGDGLNNTIEFNTVSTTLNFSVTVTDPNRCEEIFTETHSLQSPPILDLTGITDDESFCADESDPTLGLVDSNTDGDGNTSADNGTFDLANVTSWTVNSYLEGNSGSPTALFTGSGDLPTIDLDAWHTDARLGGMLVGGV